MRKIITITTLIVLSLSLIASNHSKLMQTFAQPKTQELTYDEEVYVGRLNMSYVKDKESLKQLLLKDYRTGHQYSQHVVFYDDAKDLDLISLLGGWPVFVDNLKETDNLNMTLKSLESYIKENNIQPNSIFTPKEPVYAYKRVLGDDWHSYPDPNVKFSEQDEWVLETPDPFDGYWFGLEKTKINHQDPEQADEHLLKIQILGQTCLDGTGYRCQTKHFKILTEEK